MVQYLYNSHGEWIAFRDGAYVYDTRGDFIGFLAEDGENIADLMNDYYGTIYPGDRLYRRVVAPKIDAQYPGFPRRPAIPTFPGFAGSAVLPAEAAEIRELTPA